MVTSYGLEFILHDNDYLNTLVGYERTVARCHLANCGKIITFPDGEVIDNEYDLSEIYNLIS